MNRLWYRYMFLMGLLSVIVYIVYSTGYSRIQLRRRSQFNSSTEVHRNVCQSIYNDPQDFQGFDNVSGTPDGCYIVPNVVHFVRIDQPKFSFVDAVCVLAALKNQRPEKIYFHTDAPKFYGKYWNVIMRTPGAKGVIELKFMQPPKEIYGQKFNVVWKQHTADVARLLVLMEFGGIYLDNDSYVVRDLNEFRRFELAIGWTPNENIGNQVIISHKNARFLRQWLLTYKGHYRPHEWYYNAGIRPTEVVLSKHPELVHRVSRRFAEYYFIPSMLYLEKSRAWLEHYVIHLFIHHMHTMLGQNLSSVATYPVVFNENNIKLYDCTFRDMVYDVYKFN